MSYLVDTDIASAYLKNDRAVVGRVMLHFGALYISAITLGELLTWALRANAPPSRLQGVQDLLRGVTVLEVTRSAAEKFGEIRAALLDQGLSVGEMDLLNGSIALIHNLTVAMHNLQDYSNIPGVVVDDWLVP